MYLCSFLRPNYLLYAYGENIIALMKYTYTVQLKCNLTPAHGLVGEKVWVNLQTDTDKGAGARKFLTNPAATYGVRFDTSFLNTLLLTITYVYELPMLYDISTVV